MPRLAAKCPGLQETSFIMSCLNSLQTSGSSSTLSWRKSSGNVMVLSKLYVVGSVLISNLKITKCKIAKENGWREVLEGKKPLLFTSVLLSLCIRHISRSACLWLREKMPDSKSFLHGENIVPSWEKNLPPWWNDFSPYRNDLVLVDKDINPSKD